MAGLMANTENTHTDYHTGTEFHLEYVLNQFVTNFLSVGLHGYFYDQIADDSPGPSTTAALTLLNLSASDLRSTSQGLRPQVNWVVNDNLLSHSLGSMTSTLTTACRRTTSTPIRTSHFDRKGNWIHEGHTLGPELEEDVPQFMTFHGRMRCS